MEPATAQATRRPAWLVGLAPLAVLAVAIGLFVLLDAPGLDRIGVPQEELAVERTVLKPGEIELHVRNDGADPVQIKQAIVNDGFTSFTQSKEEIGRLGGAEVKISYPWIEGENYEVMLLTSTGATIDHAIEAAVETPDADVGFYGLMALIGIYVGVIPVAIGMLWLPWLRTVDARWIRFLLAFTVGLLGFLAIEALLEGSELAGEGPAALGGGALVWLGAAGAYLALAGVDAWLRGRTRRAVDTDDASDEPDAGGAAGSARRLGERAALLVALGIGLHNLGEGLAIGTSFALGELALGTFLIVGFMIHNVTEGLGIATAATDERRVSFARLALLVLIAGAPAILGTLVGGYVRSDVLGVLFFAAAAGAAFEVVVEVGRWLRTRAPGGLTSGWVLGGFLAGVTIMYVTGVLAG
jgi:zinc transporter, ZIP family